jgi:hypothetical protein
MELLVFLIALVSLALLAARFGHDSRPGFDGTPGELIARDGLVAWDRGIEPAPDPAAQQRRQTEWRHWYRLAHS